VPRKNKASAIIENFMVSANSTMAKYLETRGIPALQRVVRSPQRWPRIVELAARLHEQLPAEADPVALSQFLIRRRLADPMHFPDLSLSVVKLLGAGEYEVVRSREDSLGHFGLAVHSYTHSTAPNRRFADVVIQRLIKGVFSGEKAPYTVDDLMTIARGCTERENAARKVERLMRKVAAALMMHGRIGQEFDGIVTGASSKGTYVRLLSPPVEGRVTESECDLDVGDRARVRLINTDPERGFIDFQCLYER
jgi:exoribonuclease-2